jgi:hypothetical protein
LVVRGEDEQQITENRLEKILSDAKKSKYDGKRGSDHGRRDSRGCPMLRSVDFEQAVEDGRCYEVMEK